MQIKSLKSQEKSLSMMKKRKKEVNKITKLKNDLRMEEEKLNIYESLLNTVANKTQKDYFLWDIDFIEVFSYKGGFDIVIGNPPYVRQELIAPPLSDKNNYSDDEWRTVKKEYKEKLIQTAKSVWGNTIKIDKKSDLYVYFYYQGLSLLRPGGIFCFINSNSWLDVGYGAGLQEFLLKNMKPLYVFDNLVKRSFKQAAVNTVIVLIQRPENKPDDYTIKFVAFKKPFEDVSNAEIIKAIESENQPVFDNENFRIYPKTKKELLLEGVEFPKEEETLIKPDLEHLPYIGNKWGGKYLRAPEIYFKILEKGKGKLVRLGDIAEVRFGIKTGANEFFYVEDLTDKIEELIEIKNKIRNLGDFKSLDEIKKANLRIVRNMKTNDYWLVEEGFLKPVIKSLKELLKIEDNKNFRFKVLICNMEESKLRNKKVLDYIKWGEQEKYNLRPSCSSRKSWYSIETQIPGDFIFSMTYGDRYLSPINEGYNVDAAIYQVYIKELYKRYLSFFKIYFNCSIFPLFIEIFSRVMTGSLPLAQMKAYEWLSVGVFLFADNQSKKLFINRPIYSIFTELGFDPSKPIREQEPNPLPDRKALDDIVFDALGLTEEERKEVYWAVAELVKTRLEKARSV